MPSLLPSEEPSRSDPPSAQPSTVSALLNAGSLAKAGGLSPGGTAGVVIAVLLILILCGIMGYYGWKNRDEYKEKWDEKFGQNKAMAAGKFDDDSTNNNDDEHKFDLDDDRSKGTDDDFDTGSADHNKIMEHNRDLEKGDAAVAEGETAAKAGVLGMFAVPAFFRRSTQKEEDPPPTVADSHDSEKDFDKSDSQPSAAASKRSSFSFFAGSKAGSKSGSKRDELDDTGTDSDPENDYSDASDPIPASQKPSENESAIRRRLLADDMSSGSESELSESDDDDDPPSKEESKPAGFGSVRKSATVQKDKSGGSRRSTRDEHSDSGSESESDSQSSRSYYSGSSGSSGSYSSGSQSYSSGSYSDDSRDKKR